MASSDRAVAVRRRPRRGHPGPGNASRSPSGLRGAAGSARAPWGSAPRRVRSVYGVLSEVMFDGLDVDHVILAPAGVFVLEVKWSLSSTPDLDHHRGLAADLAQARAGARKVTGLLRSVAPGIPVHTVLVLCGPGAPDLDAPAHREGVSVVNAMTRAAWAAFLAQHGPAVWSVEGARPAAEALTALRDQRITYELAHQQLAGR